MDFQLTEADARVLRHLASIDPMEARRHLQDNPELARRIRELRPGLKLLFMSGYPEHLQKRGSAQHHDENLIMKPFGNETLARRVRQLLDTDPG